MPQSFISFYKLLSSKLALVGLLLLFLVVNAVWIGNYRSNRVLDIDEAGYLGIAISNYRALTAAGLPGWFQSVQAPSIQAPMTTALASLLFSITRPSVAVGIAVPLLAGALSVASTYWLTSCVLPAQSALLAAALVASCPVILNYSRSFHFAMPATAMMTLALVCMLRSRKFSSPIWASLFGICLGLLPLARTMAISFLPGMVVGAAVLVVSKRGALLRRLGLLCWSFMVAALTAASWLFFNGRYVFAYLFSFGYGSRASEYGVKQSILGIDAWLTQLQVLLDYIYLPHALVLVAGMLSAVILATRSIRQQGFAGAVNQLAKSTALPLVLILVESLVVLTSSQNKGSAFIAPIVPLSIVLSVWFIYRLLPSGQPRAAAGVGGCAICLTAAIPLSNASWSLAYPHVAQLPILGWPIRVTDGRGTIQLYEQAMLAVTQEKNKALVYSQSQPLSDSQEKAYISLIDNISHELSENSFRKNGIAFGARHYLVNVNSLRFSALLRGKDLPPLLQVEPVTTGDTLAGYSHWLVNGEASKACLLLTLSGDSGQFQPNVSKGLLLQAAQDSGFVYSKTWMAPSGQKIGLWKRERCDAPAN
jgi:4-amino-4-deoxy-L-arabinose transferase-like glycosyltransferase